MLKQMEELIKNKPLLRCSDQARRTNTYTHTRTGRSKHTHAKANISVHSHTTDVPILCMHTCFQTLQKHTSKRPEKKHSRQLLKRQKRKMERGEETLFLSNQRRGGERKRERRRSGEKDMQKGEFASNQPGSKI